METEDESKNGSQNAYKPPLPYSRRISHQLMHSQISLYQPEVGMYLSCTQDSN